MGKRGAVQAADGEDATSRVEGCGLVPAVERPVAVLDQSVAAAVGGLEGGAYLLERPLVTRSLDEARAVCTIGYQPDAERVCPPMPEPTQRGGHAGMVEARQRDPAQVEVWRDLVLLAGLDVARVADVPVTRAVDVLCGRGREAASCTAVALAHVRGGGDGGEEVFADAGFFLIRPLCVADGAIEPARARQLDLDRVVLTGILCRVFAVCGQSFERTEFEYLLKPRECWNPWPDWRQRLAWTERVLLPCCMVGGDHFRFCRVFLRPISEHVAPLRIRRLRFAHPIRNVGLAIERDALALDLVHGVPAIPRLRRNTRRCRQSLDSGDRLLLRAVDRGLATRTGDSPLFAAFLGRCRRDDAATDNQRAHQGAQGTHTGTSICHG